MDHGAIWTFCGRYGDEQEAVTVESLPADLQGSLRDAFRRLYDGGARQVLDCGVGFDHGARLHDLGLVRKVGNACHPRPVFAPQVHAWMSGADDNALLAENLRRQYQ